MPGNQKGEHLGREGLGEYSFAMALTGFAGVAADFGIYYQSIKEIAQQSGHDVTDEVGRAQSARVLLALAVAAIFVPIAVFVPMSDSARITVALLSAYHLLQAVATGYVAVLVARERMGGAGLADVSLRGGAALLASLALSPSVRLVSADANRRLLSKKEVVEEHFHTTGLPSGHGFTAENRTQGTAYYAFDKGLCRFVVLDTVNPNGYADGSILAHLGPSDMRVAIGYALGWPDRPHLPVERLDFARLARLDFEDPEGQRLSLIDDGGTGEAHPWAKSPVPAQHQIRGLGPIVMSVPDRTATDVVLRVTGLRNPCPQIEHFEAGLLKAVVGRDADGEIVRKAGVMSVVLAGGVVKPGDAIEVRLPAPPHVRLERV